MNIFDYLNDNLEDAKDKFMDSLEDFKDLIENKLKYNKAENALADCFQNKGKDIYKDLTKECMNLLNSNKSKISDTGFLNDIYNSKINNNTYFKIKDARDDVLKKYAKNTADKGNLYMIQNQNHSEDCIYTILEISNNGKDLTYFSVLENELPKGAHIDAIMRYENGKYVLDNESYKYIKSEVTNKANELIYKQNKELEGYKVENEIYYVIDTTSNTVYLTKRGDKKVFEEPNISKEIIKSVSNGHILRCVDGEYVWDIELTEKSLNPDIEFDFDSYKE